MHKSFFSLFLIVLVFTTGLIVGLSQESPKTRTLPKPAEDLTSADQYMLSGFEIHRGPNFDQSIIIIYVDTGIPLIYSNGKAAVDKISGWPLFQPFEQNRKVLEVTGRDLRTKIDQAVLDKKINPDQAKEAISQVLQMYEGLTNQGQSILDTCAMVGIETNFPQDAPKRKYVAPNEPEPLSTKPPTGTSGMTGATGATGNTGTF